MPLEREGERVLEGQYSADERSCLRSLEGGNLAGALLVCWPSRALKLRRSNHANLPFLPRLPCLFPGPNATEFDPSDPIKTPVWPRPHL